MGTKAREIISIDIKPLIGQLNKAFADEWLAYYQYWIGAKVVEGPMRDAAVVELVEHANEELAHANLLADRIIQLGGTPLLSPQDWYKETNCGYHVPADFFIKKIVQQNIEGEQCAIEFYHKLMIKFYGKDMVTYHIIEQILSDELKHEEDLQNLLKDIELIKRI